MSPRMRNAETMRKSVLTIAFLMMLSACGGGGGGGGTSPPVVVPTMRPFSPPSLTLGAAQQLLLAGQYGMMNTPDEHFSLVQSGSTYLAWSAGNIAGVHGSTALLSTNDGVTFAPVAQAGGVAQPVFGPLAGESFDSYYAAPGTVLQESGSYLMIYHGEDHTWNGVVDPTTFYATVGLATSADGVHWNRVGPIVTARDPKPQSLPSHSTGAAVPSAIVANGFIYVFYTDYPNPGAPDSNQPGLIQVARVAAGSATSPNAWKKYFNGSFGQPANAYGNSSPVVPLPDPACAPERQAGISYNTYLASYLLTFVCDTGWFFTTSTDLVHWSAPIQFFSAPFSNNNLVKGEQFDWYPALFTPGQTSNQTTGQSGYVYYAEGDWDSTPHELFRRPFTLTKAAQ
jgi:hypothetical protein